MKWIKKQVDLTIKTAPYGWRYKVYLGILFLLGIIAGYLIAR